MNNVFDSFVFKEKVESETINKYINVLPKELIDVWKNYGFGSILDGYLKIINPDDYKDIIEKYYFKGTLSIPILITAFGDIIVWQENKYISIIKFKNHSYNIMCSGFKFFWSDLNNDNFKADFLEENKYFEAMNTLGNIEWKQIYGYFPLIPIAGNDDPLNIKIVNALEHLELIGDLLGLIE